MEVDYEKETWSILVVDDVQVHRFQMASGLGRINPFLKITEATSIAEAVKKLEQPGARFDIVVSDWNMPGGGGDLLVKWMRVRHAYKKIPFLMISSNKENSDIIKAFMELGVDAYVVKPFTPQDLYVKIRQAIEKGC